MLTIVYFYLLLFLVTRVICVEGACDCSQPNSKFATDVNLIYYKCNNEIPATIAYPIAAPEGLLNELEDKRTIFYVFGYIQFPENANVKLMMEALCYNRTDNVVLLDWSKYSRSTYRSAFQNAEKVGSLFARSIRLLVNSGLDVSKIYIVGHSLGAHIAGFAGKCNDFVIPRITGLDPANRIFYPLGCYLTPADAAWVDIIYTDMGGYGTFECMGTANYYANGGTYSQPGCTFIGLIIMKAQSDCMQNRNETLQNLLQCSVLPIIVIQTITAKTIRGLTLDMLHQMYADHFISVQELYEKLERNNLEETRNNNILLICIDIFDLLVY